MKCKVGRRRKSGERYPSGKLKPRKTLKPDIEPMSPALWQRIRQHGRQLGADPRLETELGRLNLHGELTVAMTVTGFGIGEIYGRYESYNRLSSSPKSPSYNASVGEAGISEDLLLPEQIEDRERRIRNATRAWEQLEAKIPHELRGPIHDLCVSNKHVSPVLYEDIRQLLSRLATEWNMHGAPRESTPPTVNRRHGPPLHFNKHETESRPKSVPTITLSEKRPNFDRIYFIQVLREANPLLTVEQAGDLYDKQQALKQRAIFRREKERNRSNCLHSGIEMPASRSQTGKAEPKTL